MDETQIERVKAMAKCEVIVVKTDLKRETVYKKLQPIRPDVLVKKADKPGFMFVGAGDWPHERFEKRAANKSGYDPSGNLRRKV